MPDGSGPSLPVYETFLAVSTQAAACANAGKYSQARDIYLLLIQSDPENDQLWASIGHCYLLTRAYEAALSAYCKALELAQTNDPQVLFGLAVLYMLNFEFQHAERCVLLTLSTCPDFFRRAVVHY